MALQVRSEGRCLTLRLARALACMRTPGMGRGGEVGSHTHACRVALHVPWHARGGAGAVHVAARCAHVAARYVHVAAHLLGEELFRETTAQHELLGRPAEHTCTGRYARAQVHMHVQVCMHVHIYVHELLGWPSRQLKYERELALASASP